MNIYIFKFLREQIKKIMPVCLTKIREDNFIWYDKINQCQDLIICEKDMEIYELKQKIAEKDRKITELKKFYSNFIKRQSQMFNILLSGVEKKLKMKN